MQERAKGDGLSPGAFYQSDAPAETDSTPDPPHVASRHSDLANLAYQLWNQRGCPSGSPEEDWYEAERRVKLESAPPEELASVRPKR